MTRAAAFLTALLLAASIPGVARAQCGYIPCGAYIYAPAVGSFAARMGASPGWAGAGIQMLNRNPVRYPPAGVWQPYRPPLGYYAYRPAMPGMWYPTNRY